MDDSALHGVIVKAVGFKHQLLRVQKFRLKPRPCRLFSSHAMVFEKAAGREGRGPGDAHPAHFLAADQRAQAEVQPNRHAYGQQGADKLPGGEPEKDRLLIIPNFFWYFYFDKNQLSSKIGCISPIFEYNKNRRCCI